MFGLGLFIVQLRAPKAVQGPDLGGGAEIFSWGTSLQVYLRDLEHRLGIPLYPRTGKKTSSGRAEAWAGAIL